MFEKWFRFPEWFSEWNANNPTDYYGPVIVFGALGAGLIGLVALVVLGQPFATDSLQTGPRGTGMSRPEFVRDVTRPDPDIEEIVSDEPFIPEGDEALARDIYENVPVLGDLTEDNFLRLMNAITLWVSPDEGCAYCHGDGDVETYGDDSLYTKVVSRRMIEMTRNINENWDDHVNANGEVGVTCFTCHRGEPVPSGIWYRITPVTNATSGWSANQNLATEISQSTSLPSDALEKYLADFETIAVHDLESRVPGVPGRDVPSIQDTERTYALMNHFANSLGVNCVFCHNSRAFYDGAEVTPQWGIASLGIAMVQELNTEFLIPLGDELPANRLGPVHADAPKLACNTCHKGYQRPLQGANVIADWPELRTGEAPVYDRAR